tara:strand:- start:152 stop:550 length:399 start_codon:yes stop_codon:yes gene_type:complete
VLHFQLIGEIMPESFITDWTTILAVAAVGFAAILGLFLASYILAPKRKSADKGLPYECGIRPSKYNWSQVNIRYYIFAMLFLIFDVEAVFLFPWAIIFVDSVAAVFYEMLIFIAILLFGLLYAWKRGALQWN